MPDPDIFLQTLMFRDNLWGSHHPRNPQYIMISGANIVKIPSFLSAENLNISFKGEENNVKILNMQQSENTQRTLAERTLS